MNEWTVWALFWVVASLLIGFVSTQIRACEQQVPAQIAACRTACGEGNVRETNGRQCECK